MPELIRAAWLAALPRQDRALGAEDEDDER